MAPLPLLNFLLHNFLRSNVVSILYLTCWDRNTLHTLSVMSSRSNVFTRFLHMYENDCIMDFLQPEKRSVTGVFLDVNCNSSWQFLAVASQQRLFRADFHWLLYDEFADVENFQRQFSNFNLSVNADLTYAYPNEAQVNSDNETSSFILVDVYNNGRHLGGKLNMTLDQEVACDLEGCQISQYLTELHLRTKYGNRNLLKDVTIRVATVISRRSINLPESELQEFLMSANERNVDTLVRYGYRQILLMRDSLGCNMSLMYTNSWGKTEITGGAIGPLVEETAELISTPLVITFTRLKYLSVLAETGTIRLVCMFRTPHNSGMQGVVFLEPFDAVVWIIFGLILLVSAACLWSSFFVEQHRMPIYTEYVPSFLTTSLISIGTACIQGSWLIPQSTGGRMIFFCLSLITFIMFNYYTSIVVSTLLGSPVKSNIKTLGQLADSPLEVTAEPIPFIMVYLNNSRLPEVRRFVNRKVDARKDPHSFWMAAEEAILKVRDKPGFVYSFDANSGYAIVEKFYEPQEICDLNEVLLRTETTMHTHVSRNSDYKELFRLKILRQLETGLILRHRRYWMPLRLHCFSSNIVVHVGLEYTAPLFFMLLSAYVIVILLLFIEVLHKRWKQGKQMKKKLNRLIEESIMTSLE